MQLSLLTSVIAVGVFIGLGKLLTLRLPIFTHYNIPASVVGGLLGATSVAVLHATIGVSITINRIYSDLLLVIYFATVGLATDLRDVGRGGRPLVILSLLAVGLIVAQNLLSVFLALAFGYTIGEGLLAGSLPFVGGFGSSAAWSSVFEGAGIANALPIALSCSTLGLIAGTVLAGPFVTFLINNHLPCESLNSTASTDHRTHQPVAAPMIEELLITGAGIALAILCGDHLRDLLVSLGITLPRFLTAMIVAILFRSVFGRLLPPTTSATSEYAGDVALQAFIVLVLCGLQLWAIDDLLLPLLTIAILQSAITILFCWKVLFPMMGRNYEAAVMAGATVGYGLSSFAIAMATLKTAVRRYGPAPQATLLMPIAGAAVVDLANNLIVGLVVNLVVL